MKLFLLFFALTAVISSCLLEPSPDPDKAVVDEIEESTEVNLSLSANALGAFAETMEAVRISVYQSNDGQRGDLIGEPHDFSISETGRYKLQGLSTGPKFFLVELLGEGAKVIARGETFLNVTLGAQSVDSVTLSSVGDPSVAIRFEMDVALTNLPIGGPDVEPQALSIMKEGFKCQNCHASTVAGGLDLNSDPIKSGREPLASNYLALVEEIVARVKDDNRPMPPFGSRLDATQIETMETWLMQVKAASTPEVSIDFYRLTISQDDQDIGNFRLSRSGDGSWVITPDLVLGVGQSFQFAFSAMTDEESTLDAWQETLKIPLDGNLRVERVITYQEPAIDI
ncbi:c-type cytochrome [Pseudobacteriovorax antillogorgiicola]|uniref:Cytochrome C oxidase, cbb3-type, subunit III n=1 Tax=Pseudobacteriovorax antillogorgiicola TaxID=1513793 RepID=A0A1Y6BFS0_9BACT|nr:cytochrome c [Pseudobacteriovorax antillogorgiicola]TCS56280.1 cbb3-type cytochrome c oxidase subunit III [Pseudobacteriovorax antillogorgiicola]SMF07673.1 Cytochrome C oxidase, cbb3-type, subunit III [Pseudobacteriovorax antillogorgiicola]